MAFNISLTILWIIGSLLLVINEAKPAADQQQDPEKTTDQEVETKAIQEVVTKTDQGEEPAQNKDSKPLENEAAERTEDQEAEPLLTNGVEPQAITDKVLLVEEDEEGDDEPTANEDPECPAEWKSFQESCYYFGSSPSYLSWAGASSACEDLHENSPLPSVHSCEEDQYMQANTASLPFWLGASRNVGADYLLTSSWT